MYYIFGGEQYYASGGCNDLLCYCREKEAAIAWSKRLIGKKVLMKEEGIPEEFWIDYPIEWTHVMSEIGTIIHTEGVIPHGFGNGEVQISNDGNKIIMFKKE